MSQDLAQFEVTYWEAFLLILILPLSESFQNFEAWFSIYHSLTIQY